MRRKLAMIFLDDDDPEGAKAKRASLVEAAEVSGKAMVDSKKAADGLLGINPLRTVAMLLTGWRGEIRSIRSANTGAF
ncbi:MAG: hypothetical protein OXI01_21740 [Albidovulum sp.]|nr:hypothetical protein [Albidovulum sp.]